MIQIHSFALFATHLGAFIERCGTTEPAEAEFDELARALFALQFESVAPYRRVCAARGVTPETVRHWREIPAMPTTAFKELELTSLAPQERTHVFHSSGTTGQVPSRHFHSPESLAIYEASLKPWFHRHFVDDAEKIPALILTPSPALVPHSSLVHMMESVKAEFSEVRFTGKIQEDGAWALDTWETVEALRKAVSENRPLAVMGTAFSFVALLDACAENQKLALPKGSRVFETGGYKGRSRVLSKLELHQYITRKLRVPSSSILSEYGMSELSSQAYDGMIGQRNTSRVFRFPPWARARVISPESGEEVSDGEIGLLRIFDLANVRSVLAVQTEDLAVRRGAGFELIGRAALAEPRGCSLMEKIE